mmetsp:Transcript_31486/g.28668  ORF Transcript_31486/g.28668 Transcript_31486/m.28668 type:complete len:100 (+) Transcript_31486:213-512(+)
MQTPLLEYFSIENLQFNMIFTLYNIPAIFTLILGGMLIDRFGIRVMQVIFLTIGISGKVVSSIAIANKSFGMLLGGRVIAGLTSECVYIGNAYYVSRWF